MIKYTQKEVFQGENLKPIFTKKSQRNFYGQNIT